MASDRVEAEAAALYFCDLIATAAMHPWLWQNFGFRSTPKRGMIRDRLRSADQLADETFLVREFTIVGFERVMKGVTGLRLGEDSILLLARVYELLVKGPAPGAPFRPVFAGFSQDEWAEYLTAGLAPYMRGRRASFDAIFISRAPIHHDPDTQAGWSAAATAIMMSPSSPLRYLPSAVDRTLRDKALTGTPALDQERFLNRFIGIIKGQASAEE